MLNCGVCGNDYLRCNCESQQPFCDQCSENQPCSYEVNSKCVTYHPLPTTQPSKLDNLGLPNGSTAETIFEAIDDFLGNSANISITAIDSNTVDITANGLANHTIKADVKVSTDALNQIEIRSNGLYGKIFNPEFLVKVDPTDTADYLEEQIVGGSDGIVSVSVVNTSGLLEVIPEINITSLVTGLCSDSGFEDCIASKIPPIIPIDTNSINLTVTGTDGHTLQADAIISPDASNALEIRANGLYATGGATITADNGLTKVSNNIQLGGTLLNQTVINAQNFELDVNGSLALSLGSGNIVQTLSTALVLTGGGTLASAVNTAAAFRGQLEFSQTSDQTLDSNPHSSFAGIYGYVLGNTSNNITGNVISGGYFGASFREAGNYSDVAGIRISGINSGLGGTYTGTTTNYFGLRIEDIGASSFASQITNKYAIYQLGTADISRFFGPVQNAGGTTQFTSDVRVKENIASFTRGLTEIDQINTKTFNYVYNKNTQITGIIAQELETIIPEAVKQGNFTVPNGESYADFRMVDQNVLFYTMLNAIKELSTRVKALENI